MDYHRATTGSLTFYSKNSSTARDVAVTINTWPLTYVYARSDLFLAYGLSLFCALGCSVVGFYAFSMNKASYQNIFSTFLRATNDLAIRSEVPRNDQGSDPLPKTFASTMISFNHNRRSLTSILIGSDAMNSELRSLHPHVNAAEYREE